jgi:hypothetical protein
MGERMVVSSFKKGDDVNIASDKIPPIYPKEDYRENVTPFHSNDKVTPPC